MSESWSLVGSFRKYPNNVAKWFKTQWRIYNATNLWTIKESFLLDLRAVSGIADPQWLCSCSQPVKEKITERNTSRPCTDWLLIWPNVCYFYSFFFLTRLLLPFLISQPMHLHQKSSTDVNVRLTNRINSEGHFKDLMTEVIQWDLCTVLGLAL